jgi:hypothetical protein
MSGRVLFVAACAVPIAVFLGIYAPSVGLGFISDDLGWIIDSRVDSITGVIDLFTKNHGFYRPLVATSFALDHAIFGSHPYGYGLTNLLLALTCAALIALMARALDFSLGAAAFAAAVWLFNFHGMNMALLWLSGRTALLLIVGAVGAVIAVLKGRPTLAIGCVLFALFSKEEALMLPVLLVAARMWRSGRKPITGSDIWLIVGVSATLAIYMALRIKAGAMTPATAPYYYQFNFAPSAVARNIAQYADRACSFSALTVLVAWFTLRPERATDHLRPGIIALGVAWVVAGYAITVFLPVRSSLYACFPSIGAVLIAAECCRAFWVGAPATRRRRGLAAMVVIPIACAPIYASRNHRWTDLALFSTRILHDFQRLSGEVPDVTHIDFQDDRSQRVNLQSAFGTLIGNGLELQTGRPYHIRVSPPIGDGFFAEFDSPCSSCRKLTLVVRDGMLFKL